MVAVAFGIFGLIVGSFLNVLIIRHGVRSVNGRSGCMACGKQLGWYDMIPVVSWLILRGRCRECRARISIQYPLVEVALGILFATIGGAPIDMYAKIAYCVIAALFVAIAAYDIRHTIIPDPWAYTLAALALLTGAFTVDLDGFVLFLFAGPLAALPLFLLWFVSGGRWMGLGDSKLALGIGWLLGIPLGVASVFFAFILGAVISVGVLIPLPHIVRVLGRYGITSLDTRGGGFTMTSEIPFGPFLIVSCILLWLCTLYGVDPLLEIGLLPLAGE